MMNAQKEEREQITKEPWHTRMWPLAARRTQGDGLLDLSLDIEALLHSEQRKSSPPAGWHHFHCVSNLQLENSSRGKLGVGVG